MSVDLDKFERLNDTYGHHVGDIALRVVAERLLSVFGPHSVVARLAEGDLGCVNCDLESETTAVKIGQRFLDALKTRVVVEDAYHRLRESVGVLVGQTVLQRETILSRSDIAMYWAKVQRAEIPVPRIAKACLMFKTCIKARVG